MRGGGRHHQKLDLEMVDGIPNEIEGSSFKDGLVVSSSAGAKYAG